MIKLKPCPRCGGKARVLKLDNVKKCCILCSECHNTSRLYDFKIEAVKAWNEEYERMR